MFIHSVLISFEFLWFLMIGDKATVNIHTQVFMGTRKFSFLLDN